MWNKFFEIARWIVLFTENTKQLRADLNALQQELKRQNDKADAREREQRAAIERLIYEIRRVSDHDEHEREKLLLKIENQLLRLSLPATSKTVAKKPIKLSQPGATEDEDSSNEN